jgi:N-succinyldiaminopimelate aminotransferase
MNPFLGSLQPYPFTRIANLLEGLEPPPGKKLLRLSIGEPQHKTPAFILEALTNNLEGFSRYPATVGSQELREAILAWLTQRYALTTTGISVDNLLPVNGTREALFAIAQLLVDQRKPGDLVAMPNPFYQIYEGAALLAGAHPLFLNCSAENSYLPDFDAISARQWSDVQAIYICNPGNPSGAVMSKSQLTQLISLADQHDFVILSDECYSEIYQEENIPPTGLLEVCKDLGRNDFSRCLVFHSLSKRSNMPGFRSGFVAGDSKLIKAFLQYRTYHGCAMPEPIQIASIAAWGDEQHVLNNRQAYREKFAAILPILQEEFELQRPDASFYCWLNLNNDDQDFAKKLYQEESLIVVPGSYLARDTKSGNPGRNHIRLALVGSIDDCIEGAQRIVDCHRRQNSP